MSPPAVELLDDQGALAAGDRSDLLRATASAAAQVREAALLSTEAGIARLQQEDRPRSVVLLGMGTAGQAGELFAALAGPTCPVPVLTHRGPALPPWVGAADLVVALSSSGRTPETRSGLEEAVRRGCRLLVVAADPSPIADLGHRGRGVVVPVPPGRPARATLWALTVPLLLAVDALGLLRAPPALIEQTAVALEAVAQRCGPATDLVVNPAKTLALELLDALPVLWGSSPLAGVAAARGAGQLAETAAVPALWGALPEAGHQQLALLDGPFTCRDPAELFADPYDDDQPMATHSRLRVVLLREEEEDLPSALRAQTVLELAESRGVGVSSLLGAGSSPLERAAALIGTLDFAAVYLALLQGNDPTQTTAIDELKGRTSR